MSSKLIPLYEVEGAAHPLGMAMCQNRLAVPTWSYAMEACPPRTIVEIGTYNGGFTTALAVHAHFLGARVVTFDRCLPDERISPLARHLGVEFVQGDVWQLEDRIGALVGGPGQTFLLCDGGDKRRELQTFARYLKPGDVIGAHDYHVDGSNSQWWAWSEIRKEDGDAVAARHDLAPWLQDHFDTAGWLVYRRHLSPLDA